MDEIFGIFSCDRHLFFTFHQDEALAPLIQHEAAQVLLEHDASMDVLVSRLPYIGGTVLPPVLPHAVTILLRKSVLAECIVKTNKLV